MSKAVQLSLPVIEWSPSRVTAYDPQSRQHANGSSISDVAHILQGAKTVVVALSRRSSYVRTLRLPDVGKVQAAQVLGIQLGNILPVAPADAAYDFRLSGNVNPEGRLAVIAAVAVDTLKQVHSELRKAGLTAQYVVPTAFGSWLLSRSLEVDQCAVVEHVPEGLAIDIISEGELRYTRVVPMPKDSEGIEAEVCRTFSVAKVPCSQIVATAGLVFGGADTQVATRPLEIFSTGLLSRLDLNIELPEEVAARQRRTMQSRMRLTILLWLAAAICGSYVFLDRQDAASKVRSIESRQNAEMSKLRAVLAIYEGDLKTAQDLQATLSAAFKPAQRMTDVVTTFSNAVPANVWITGFTFERGKPLLVRGTAMTSDAVAGYVQTLATEPRFRDVRLVFANNATLENTPVVQFSLTAHVMGNFPLTSSFGGGAKK